VKAFILDDRFDLLDFKISVSAVHVTLVRVRFRGTVFGLTACKAEFILLFTVKW